MREVVAGGVPMSARIARKVIGAFRVEVPVVAPHANLTPREQTVLQKLAEGMSDKEIASELSIADGTVRLHLNQI